MKKYWLCYLTWQHHWRKAGTTSSTLPFTGSPVYPKKCHSSRSNLTNLANKGSQHWPIRGRVRQVITLPSVETYVAVLMWYGCLKIFWPDIIYFVHPICSGSSCPLQICVHSFLQHNKSHFFFYIWHQFISTFGNKEESISILQKIDSSNVTFLWLKD